MGILQLIVITSVYNYLNNVHSIEVMPDSHASPLDGHVNGGISCYSWPKFDGCNTMSYLMDNATKFNTTINSTDLNVVIVPNNKWRCDLFTDYSKRSLQDTFSSFNANLILLFIFTCTYVLSAIIHDFTLIYHRNHLDKVIFHPIDSDCYLVSKFFNICELKRSFVRPYGGPFNAFLWCTCVNIFVKCLFCPLWFVWVVIVLVVTWAISIFFVIIDAVGYLSGFYPLIYWCINKGTNHRHYINVVSYISSSWVGVSKCGMVYSTISMLAQISEGVSSKVPSPEPDKCVCECVYVLHQNDYYAWLFVTISFILLNVKSVCSWMNESFHKQHYLYLILCSLRLKYVNQINPEDSLDDGMVQIQSRNRSRNDEYENGIDDIQDDEQLIEENSNECQSSESSKQDTFINTAFWWRYFFLVSLIYSGGYYITSSIHNLKEINFYHYSDAIKKVLNVAWWIGFISYHYLAFWIIYSRAFSVLDGKTNENKNENRQSEIDNESDGVMVCDGNI